MPIINKILNKYKIIPVTVKAAFWFVICTLMQKCISFLTIPIFTRLMSQEEYGVYSTYLSWHSIFMIICTLNIHNVVYVNQMTNANTQEETNRLVIPHLSLSMVVTVLVSGVILCVSNGIKEIVGLPMMILVHIFVQILFQIPVNFWMVKQRYAYNYIRLVCFSVAMTMSNALLGILFVWFSTGDKAVARVISISSVQIVFGIILYYEFFRMGKRIFSTKGWKHTLDVQLPLIPHGLASNILYSADRIMINVMIGASEAGIYSLAYSVGYVASMLKQCIVDALKPWLLRKLRNGEYKEIQEKTKPIFFIVALICVVMILFGPEIISILGPAEYKEAVYAIPAITVSSYFSFLYSMFSFASFYYEKTKKIMYISISAAILNLILNAICIPIFGYIAAAYTTLTCYIYFAVVHYRLMCAVCYNDPTKESLYDMKYIIKISIAITVLSSVILLVYEHFYVRYSIIIVVCVVLYFNKKHFIRLIDSFIKRKG